MANTPTPHSAPVPFRAFFVREVRSFKADAGFEFAAPASVRAKQVYLAAAISLLLGLAVGYVSRGLQWQPLASGAASSAAVLRSPHAPTRHVPTLDEMKQMADQQAAPVLEKLKTQPNKAALLMQAGAIYHASHQFKEAAAYYGQAVQADPRNVEARTRLASSLYRSGDVDGALAQLNQALAYEPRDANSLFNLGMIRLQGKGDGKGALAAWQQLLKSNPQLSAERKAEVQKLMADVLTTTGAPDSKRGAPVR
jgi:cytochrome c-type biogenesis protein CcmH/NrfG